MRGADSRCAGSRTPIWMKVDMRFDEGVGDKMILRLLAKELGLSGASQLKKRAIHFGELLDFDVGLESGNSWFGLDAGARTAKMELGSGHARGEDSLE